MASDIIGVNQLIKDFEKLESATGSKIMRQAASAAVNPTLRIMRAAAPVGKDVHRTYKGRLVAPGFSKRSLTKRSSSRGGVATVTLGVKSAEAFYSLQFLDEGNYRVTQRRYKGRVKQIKPYQIRGKGFFKKIFAQNSDRMVDEFSKQIRKKIDKI